MRGGQEYERDVRRVRDRVLGLPRRPWELSNSLLAVGTLRKAGWLDRHPTTPWLTYPAIHFLESLRTEDLACLEFGSGASTAWLNARFGTVRSVEHDPAWYARVRKPGYDVQLREFDGDSYSAGTDCPYLTAGRAEVPWDVVMIDGVARVTCVQLVDDYVAPDGLVVLDDTDLPGIRPAVQILRDNGFLGIDFWGLRPGVALGTCTSVYSRDMTGWLRRLR